jgi:hypothetical protein
MRKIEALMYRETSTCVNEGLELAGCALQVVRCERAGRRKNRSQKVTKDRLFLQKGNKGNEGLKQKDRLQHQCVLPFA